MMAKYRPRLRQRLRRGELKWRLGKLTLSLNLRALAQTIQTLREYNGPGN